MNYLKNISIIATCLVCLASASSQADILRTIDFENDKVGPVGTNPYLNPSGNSPEIVTAQNGVSPRSGKHMMRTYLNRETSETNYRTEARLEQDFDKGKEYWLGVSVFLPQDWSMDYGGSWTSQGIVLQFHDRAHEDPTWRALLPFIVEHHQDGWRIKNHALSGKEINQSQGTGNLKTFSTIVPYKLGQWNDFVLNVKFSGAESRDDTNGFIKVWVNGNQVLNHVGQNYYGEQTKGPYFKLGIYSAGWKQPDKWVGPSSRLLYHDALRVGDANSSYAEVSPGTSVTVDAPPSPPSNIQAN